MANKVISVLKIVCGVLLILGGVGGLYLYATTSTTLYAVVGSCLCIFFVVYLWLLGKKS